jgi:CRP-like cAMP-binding protein
MNSTTAGSSTGANSDRFTKGKLHARGNSVRAWQPGRPCSPRELATLAEHGEERRAEVGDVLFRVGDRRYPLIAIIEGEAAVLDQTGAEINRHGSGGFLGESNLLSGQTVFFTAVVTGPLALHRRRA